MNNSNSRPNSRMYENLKIKTYHKSPDGSQTSNLHETANIELSSDGLDDLGEMVKYKQYYMPNSKLRKSIKEMN